MAACSDHCSESESIVHILSSPPNPAEAATVPEREVAMWWQPTGCAPERLCTRGMSGLAVEYILIVEDPDAERSCVGVTATANMSVG